MVESGRDMSRRAALWGLAVVLLLALALRLYGLDWDEGFGWTPHPDERAILFKVVALSFPGVSDLPLLLDADESPWNPRWFPYGSFPIYVLNIAGALSGFIPGLDPNDLRVTGRAVSALRMQRPLPSFMRWELWCGPGESVFWPPRWWR